MERRDHCLRHARGFLDPGCRRQAGQRQPGFLGSKSRLDSILANADLFSEISPFWYRVLADGRVVPYTTASGGTYVDPGILSFLRAHGILVIPTVANIIDGVWDGAAVSKIIADPQLRAFNIANLVNLAINGAYDGIDLDYEDLRATDRSAFTTFVRELASALHAEGKLLTVNVYAKTSEPGTWDGPRAQDWLAIGQVADQVRIMTYEYSWSTSSAGPISPVNWVGDVIAFARTQIAAQKIMQGVPFYGYDWVGQRGTELVWGQAMGLANQHAAPINWDAAGASPWFEYVSRLDSAHCLVRERCECGCQVRSRRGKQYRGRDAVATRGRGPRQLVGGALAVWRQSAADGHNTASDRDYLAVRRRIGHQKSANRRASDR